ncbi:MAG: NUDIX domain-containing protein [bacterium]
MSYRQRFEHYDVASTTLSDVLAPLRYCPYCGAETEEPLLHRLRCDTCGRRIFRNPDPGTVILVEREDKLLLGRRAAGYGAGTWGLPGGFVEYDEDFLAGARREVREESGLDVTIDAIVNVTSNLLRPQLHTIAIVVLAHPVGGAEMPGDDLDLLEWFDRHRELPPLAFDADAHIIQVWKERGLAQIPVGPPA